MATRKEIDLLLVDDDDDQMMLEELYLKELNGNLRIAKAHRAKEAFSLLMERHFDAVVCDYYLPEGSDGIELCGELKRNAFRVPFIIFTGRGNEEIAERALEAGVDMYLRKEADPKVYETLYSYIRFMVAKYRADEVLRRNEEKSRELAEKRERLLKSN